MAGDLDIIALCETEERLEAEIELLKAEVAQLNSILKETDTKMDRR